MTSRRIARYVVVTLLNILVFYFLYDWCRQNIHWSEFREAIRLIPMEAMAVAFSLGIAVLAVYAKRLACLTGQAWGASFWIMVYGFGANNILPFRLGDLLKIYFAKKYFNMAATRLLMVKVMEKFFDMAALLLIGGVAVLLGSLALPSLYLWAILGVLSAMLVGTVIVLALLGRQLTWLESLRKNRKLEYLLETFENVVKNPALGKGVALTGLIWVMTVTIMGGYYALAMPDLNLRAIDVLALVFLTTLSLGVPSVPGALGLYEAAIVFYMTRFLDVPAADALASALVLHLVTAIPQVALMVIALPIARWNIKIRQRPCHKYHRSG